MEQNYTEMDSPRYRMEYAGRCGVLAGGMWTASFLCSIYSLDYPLLGYVGNTVALLSLYALYLMVVRYRAFVAPLRFPGCFRMAWRICLFAGLLTTLAQYLYFRFIDGGHLVESMTRLLDNEQYRQAMKEVMPQVNPSDMKSMLSAIKVGEMTLNLWMFNIFISLPLSLIAGIFGALKNVGKYQQKQ